MDCPVRSTGHERIRVHQSFAEHIGSLLPREDGQLLTVNGLSKLRPHLH
jgi:hypothetical protein